jgi:hypothetical protein
VPIVLKSGSLSLLEPSGPVQACNGIALPYRADYVVDANGSTVIKESFFVFSDLHTLPTRSKHPLTGHCTEPDKDSLHTHTRFLRIHLSTSLQISPSSTGVLKLKFSMHLIIISCLFN